MTNFNTRSIEKSCNKCGAASGEYCKHCNVEKQKAIKYKKYQLSEYAQNAIDAWLQEQLKNDKPNGTETIPKTREAQKK